MDVQLVWLRSDLRIHDNTALAAAATKGPVIAVFLRSVAQWQSHDHGANKIHFWARGVAAVKDALHGLNIPLSALPTSATIQRRPRRSSTLPASTRLTAAL